MIKCSHSIFVDAAQLNNCIYLSFRHTSAGRRFTFTCTSSFLFNYSVSRIQHKMSTALQFSIQYHSDTSGLCPKIASNRNNASCQCKQKKRIFRKNSDSNILNSKYYSQHQHCDNSMVFICIRYTKQKSSKIF